jgi:hypothetical protein
VGDVPVGGGWEGGEEEVGARWGVHVYVWDDAARGCQWSEWASRGGLQSDKGLWLFVVRCMMSSFEEVVSSGNKIHVKSAGNFNQSKKGSITLTSN